MSWRISLSDLRITRSQREAVNGVLDAGWLSMGPWTETFEERFAAAANVPHAVGVSSASTGLLIALQASDIGPGDEVILPSLTFVADANVVRSLGATPVFADIAAIDRPLIDLDAVRALVTPATRAVMVVHYGGYAVALDEIDDLREQGIRVIEDAAHAVGPIDDTGDWLPLRGDFAVYSFFANKNLPTGEGGMVTTNDGALEARLRLLRSHGMSTVTWDRHRGHASDYDVLDLGWNGRPTELAAALGATGLPDVDENNRARRRLLDHYRAAMRDADPSGTIHLIGARHEPTTGHIAVAVLPSGARPTVRAELASAGIQSSFHYPPIHRFTAYESFADAALPVTNEAAERLVTLPLHPWMTENEVTEVCKRTVEAAIEKDANRRR